MLDYCRSHAQVVFISNVATSHDKFSSKRGQPAGRTASNLIFCRSGPVRFLTGSSTKVKNWRDRSGSIKVGLSRTRTRFAALV